MLILLYYLLSIAYTLDITQKNDGFKWFKNHRNEVRKLSGHNETNYYWFLVLFIIIFLSPILLTLKISNIIKNAMQMW